MKTAKWMGAISWTKWTQLHDPRRRWVAAVACRLWRRQPRKIAFFSFLIGKVWEILGVSNEHVQTRMKRIQSIWDCPVLCTSDTVYVSTIWHWTIRSQKSFSCHGELAGASSNQRQPIHVQSDAVCPAGTFVNQIWAIGHLWKPLAEHQNPRGNKNDESTGVLFKSTCLLPWVTVSHSAKSQANAVDMLVSVLPSGGWTHGSSTTSTVLFAKLCPNNTCNIIHLSPE